MLSFILAVKHRKVAAQELSNAVQRSGSELRALGQLRGDLSAARLGLEAAEAEVGRLSGDAQQLQQEKVSLDALCEDKERLTMQLEQAEAAKADLQAQLQEKGCFRQHATRHKKAKTCSKGRFLICFDGCCERIG